MVKGQRSLVDELSHHSKAIHALAAVLASKADFLVNFKLKDFPAVAGNATAVVGPSAFLKDLWDHDPSLIRGRLSEQAEAIDISLDLLLDRLAPSVPAFEELVRKQHRYSGRDKDGLSPPGHRRSLLADQETSNSWLS